jgi:hypothetical protein
VALFLSAFMMSQVSEAQSVAPQVIYTLQTNQKKPLLDTGKAFWKLRNDKTERPGVGETESWVEKKNAHVVMKGLLASLPGSWGRVGFSLIETAITKPIQRSEGLVFTAQGTEGLWASILVKDRQSNQSEGTLTFQWDFELKNEAQEYVAFWKDFIPKVRGKQVSGFELDLFSVHALSFQVSRSQQKQWHEKVPLEFELVL